MKYYMRKNYGLLILSFLLLNVLGWIMVFEARYSIPNVAKYLLSVLVLGILIYYRIKHPSKPVPGTLFNILIFLFVIWSVILLFFGIFGFKSRIVFQLALVDTHFYIPYLLPLILLYTKFDLNFFGNLFYYSSLFIIPACIVQLLIIISGLSQVNYFEQSTWIGLFNIASAFLLLTAHVSRKRYVSFFVIWYHLLWIILYAFYGRRGALINSLLLITFMVIIRLRSSLLQMHSRFKIYLSGLLLIILFLAFGYLFTSSYVFQRGFSRNAFEESRGTVFEAYFSDFGSTKDWIFGRGINGSILRSLIDSSKAYSVENGFLTILLKGGLFYLVPFIVILLRASYLGIFNSNNDLVKALGVIIFLYVILMVVFNLPSYSTTYIIVWISASACLTAPMRNYNNTQVFQAINVHFK